MKVKYLGIYAASLVIVAVVSAWVARSVTLNSLETSETENSVYLIGAVTVNDHERLPQYQEIAGPLAAKAGGYVPLAHSSPNMIEGKLPANGSFFIERYDSLEGLMSFINSAEFQKAKILRDEIADVHFMMWLPAVPPGSLPH
jgi:uncharacterized protein (DUF1330 family)